MQMGLTVAPFDYNNEANSGHDWKNWLKSFEFCMSASEIKDDKRKLAMLLHFAGRKVQDVYSKLPKPKQQARGPMIDSYGFQITPYEEALVKLNEFFLPKQNTTYERHVLRAMKQENDESIELFVIRLKTQAERCDFGDKIDENVKDQVIEKCRSDALRREMLKQGDANLEAVLKAARIFEAIIKQEKVFKAIETPTNVTNDVNKINVQSRTERNKNSNAKKPECFRCGYTGHRANDENYPAIGKSCNKCGNKNHFSVKCKSKRQPLSEGFLNYKNTNRNGKSESTTNGGSNEPAFKRMKKEGDAVVKYVETIKQDAGEEYVFCIDSDKMENTIKCNIGQVETLAVIDSGSKYNLIDYDTWMKLKSNNIKVSNQRLETGKVFKAYGGQPLVVAGVFETKISIAGKEAIAEFYVMKEKGKFLIGRDTASELGVLKIGCNVNTIENSEIQGKLIGKIKGVLIDIPLREDVKPVIQPYRQIAVPLEKAVEKKIDELLQQGIIEKVNGPSKWISPMVAIPKDGGKDIRICIDMRRANEAVKRENYPLPTVQSFLPYIGKGKYFTKLDVKQAFHQV